MKRKAELTPLPQRFSVPSKSRLEMPRPDILRARLAELHQEHLKLHDQLAELVSQPVSDSLRLQRLKRQKLAVKDAIARIEDELTPDIIA